MVEVLNWLEDVLRLYTSLSPIQTVMFWISLVYFTLTLIGVVALKIGNFYLHQALEDNGQASMPLKIGLHCLANSALFFLIGAQPLIHFGYPIGSWEDRGARYVLLVLAQALIAVGGVSVLRGAYMMSKYGVTQRYRRRRGD